jgi:hypothetical protein
MGYVPPPPPLQTAPQQRVQARWYYSDRDLRRLLVGVFVSAVGTGVALGFGLWPVAPAWVATLAAVLGRLYALLSTHSPAPVAQPAAPPAVPERKRWQPGERLKPRFKPVNLYAIPEEFGGMPQPRSEVK